ncbi:hypothetical protein LSAT2_023559 [Lamellibrachia satsuma]|nr:hypothetical protein LSAT2_023559 [Lamellibrachia satsuma]
MARLLRFIRLDDSFDTQVFTFALPESLPCLDSAATGSAAGDFISRDFNYGHQRWRVTFARTSSHIGASLTLAHVTTGMTCVVDFNFTMVNREHFTKNDVYSERSCQFTAESPVHARRTFVALSDLRQRGFKQDNGQYTVELEMRNVKNTFEQVGSRVSKLPNIPTLHF